MYITLQELYILMDCLIQQKQIINAGGYGRETLSQIHTDIVERMAGVKIVLGETTT